VKFQDLYNMNTQKKVFEKLFSSDKVELASDKYEFGIIQDAVKNSQDAIKEFQSGADIVFGARSKAEVNLKKAIALGNSFLNNLNEIKKVSKEFGIDLPAEIVREEKFANATISSAKSLLQTLNQLERE
jgi:hypothetical protein